MPSQRDDLVKLFFILAAHFDYSQIHTGEIVMSAGPMVSNGKPRKQLSDQLDRLDSQLQHNSTGSSTP